MPGLLGYCETKEEEDWHLEQERQAYEAARDAEDWEQMRKRIAELEAALQEIKDMKSKPIGDTGFAVGPLALLQACQRIARDALKKATV